MNYDNSLVVSNTVTCYSWAPSGGNHLFTRGAIFWPPHQLAASCNDGVSFISRQSHKFLSNNPGVHACYNYNLSLFAVPAVALNEYRRFLFVYASKPKCVNMVAIYIL